MNQYWISLLVSLLLTYFSTAIDVPLKSNMRRGSCAVDAYNKSITVHNLRNNCNNKELINIFSNLSAGAFPRSGFSKGYIIGVVQNIWNGKTINYVAGRPPNDYGIVTNTWLGAFKMFKGTIYRTRTPIDGKESFALDYKWDGFVFLAIDYIRTVQKNVYLGIATVRPYEQIPTAFFILEAD